MSRLIEQMTPDYLEDVLVRLAHHSSAIEGNKITLPETVTIKKISLKKGRTIPFTLHTNRAFERI